MSLIAWTTTPWTLPSNLALCVNPEFQYVKVKGQSVFSKALLFSRLSQDMFAYLDWIFCLYSVFILAFMFCTLSAHGKNGRDGFVFMGNESTNRAYFSDTSEVMMMMMSTPSIYPVLQMPTVWSIHLMQMINHFLVLSAFGLFTKRKGIKRCPSDDAFCGIHFPPVRVLNL